MKNKLYLVFCLITIFIFLLVPNVSAVSPEEYAAEQAESLDIESVLDALPNETRDMLGDLNITDFQSLFNTSPKALLDVIRKVFSGVWKEPSRALTELAAVLILTSVLKACSPDAESSVVRSAEIFCVAAFGAMLLPHFITVLSHVMSVIKTQEIFIKSYIPILLATVAASGNPALAFSVNALTLGAAEIVVQFANSFLTPITGIYISLVFADSVAPKFNLGGFISIFKKAAALSLGFCATLFTGILTTKGVLAGTADSVSSRGLKFALSSFVPVVGGALGDGLSSVIGGLTLLRSALGVFGILAAVLLILPTFFEIIVWNISLYLCAAVGDLFEQGKSASLLRGIAGAFTFLNVILLFQGVILVVTTGLILTLRAGG